MKALLLIPLLLTSCAMVNEKGAVMFGGKGAAKGGGEGHGGWAMVWNGEKSFRDGAVLLGTVATGYFGMATTQATEATRQVAEKQATIRHGATQKTVQHATTAHGQAYGTAVSAEVPGVVAPQPPVAPVP